MGDSSSIERNYGFRPNLPPPQQYNLQGLGGLGGMGNIQDLMARIAAQKQAQAPQAQAPQAPQVQAQLQAQAPQPAGQPYQDPQSVQDVFARYMQEHQAQVQQPGQAQQGPPQANSPQYQRGLSGIFRLQHDRRAYEDAQAQQQAQQAPMVPPVASPMQGNLPPALMQQYMQMRPPAPNAQQIMPEDPRMQAMRNLQRTGGTSIFQRNANVKNY
jgi:hypothetical protein